MESMMHPLNGLRVLDLGRYISGPFATVALAELGAEVIKVESPAGDPFRRWEGEGGSPTFAAFNRGKKSVVIDLKTDAGRTSLLRLVESSDVLVENFRPGVMDRLGIGAEHCMQRNPQLIYCSITGFGPSGPYTDRPAYDGVAISYSGLAGLLVDGDDPRLRGPAIGDNIAGYAAAMSILAAVIGRHSTGRGRRLDVSMQAAVLHFLQAALHRQVMEDVPVDAYSRPHQSQAYAFVCADEALLLVHLSSPPKFWEALCDAVERPDLTADPRFVDRPRRKANYELLRRELEPIFRTRERRHWLERLQRAQVPCGPINSIGEALADPNLGHLGTVEIVEDDSGGRRPHLRAPVRMDGEVLESDISVPGLGEHNDSLLSADGTPA